MHFASCAGLIPNHFLIAYDLNPVILDCSPEMKETFLSSWQLIKFRALPGQVNMDIDRRLYEEMKSGTGKPTLRFFGWQRPTISYGMNQRNIEKIIDFQKCRDFGIDIVQRPTGGRELLHGYDLSYSVVGNMGVGGNSFKAIRERCADIHSAIISGLVASGLSRDGFKTNLHHSNGYNLTDVKPCFGTVTGDEISYWGKKLVGSAQRCEKRAFLQHGSIQLSYGTTKIVNFLAISRKEVKEQLLKRMEGIVTNLSEIFDADGVNPIDADNIENNIIDAFSRQFRVDFMEEGFPGISPRDAIRTNG